MRTTILALLLLCSCGGGGTALTSDEKGQAVAPVTIAWGFPPDGAWGYCETHGDGSVSITLNATRATNPLYQDDLLAHELGHAAGILHTDDAACIMHAPVMPDRPGPCPLERDRMLAWGAANTLEIVSCPPDLVDRVVEAINLWGVPSAFKPFHGSQGE